jgi:trk system potassium uptake protein TrkA
VLIDAGIDNADVFLAVTSDDNTNIMAAQIARDIFGVKRVIARVCEPSKEFIYRRLGIDVVKPIQLADEVIRNSIMEEGSKILSVLDNEMEVVEIPVLKNRGKKISCIEKNYECVISAVHRNGSFIIPGREDELRENDKIVCTIDSKNREKLISALAGEMFI